MSVGFNWQEQLANQKKRRTGLGSACFLTRLVLPCLASISSLLLWDLSHHVISCHVLSSLAFLAHSIPQYSYSMVTFSQQWFLNFFPTGFSMFLLRLRERVRFLWMQHRLGTQMKSDEPRPAMKRWDDWNDDATLPQTLYENPRERYSSHERFESFMDKFGYPEEWKETRKLSKAKFYHLTIFNTF